MSLLRPDGGGVCVSADGGGLLSLPFPLFPITFPITFPNHRHPLQPLNLHQISLANLAATLESETFIAARQAFERINAARTSIIESEAKSLATARLADQLKDKPETPAHAETQRKTANKLLFSTPRFSVKNQIPKESSLQTNNPPLNCSRSAVNVTARESVVDSPTRKGPQRKNPPHESQSPRCISGRYRCRLCVRPVL